MTENLWNRKAAMNLETVSDALDQAINLLDAATLLLRPLEEGGESPAIVEERHRLSDAVLLSLREKLMSQADFLREESERLMAAE